MEKHDGLLLLAAYKLVEFIQKCVTGIFYVRMLILVMCSFLFPLGQNWTISGASVIMQQHFILTLSPCQFIKEANPLLMRLPDFTFKSFFFIQWKNFAVSFLIGSVAPLNLFSLKIKRDLHWVGKETYVHPA